MAIVQFRVDDDLKLSATKVYENLGIDLSTALRMFLKRSVLENGIPFPMILDEPSYEAKDALRVLKKMQEISRENGNINMTLDEINEEIKNARIERKKKM